MPDHPLKHLIDVYSLLALIATIAGWLPHIASLLTVVWMAIRIFETETMKRFRSWLRGRK